MANLNIKPTQIDQIVDVIIRSERSKKAKTVATWLDVLTNASESFNKYLDTSMKIADHDLKVAADEKKILEAETKKDEDKIKEKQASINNLTNYKRNLMLATRVSNISGGTTKTISNIASALSSRFAPTSEEINLTNELIGKDGCTFDEIAKNIYTATCKAIAKKASEAVEEVEKEIKFLSEKLKEDITDRLDADKNIYNAEMGKATDTFLYQAKTKSADATKNSGDAQGATNNEERKKKAEDAQLAAQEALGQVTEVRSCIKTIEKAAYAYAYRAKASDLFSEVLSSLESSTKISKNYTDKEKSELNELKKKSGTSDTLTAINFYERAHKEASKILSLLNGYINNIKTLIDERNKLTDIRNDLRAVKDSATFVKPTRPKEEKKKD